MDPRCGMARALPDHRFFRLYEKKTPPGCGLVLCCWWFFFGFCVFVVFLFGFGCVGFFFFLVCGMPPGSQFESSAARRVISSLLNHSFFL